jgi:type IV pilus assembly protein PilM
MLSIDIGSKKVCVVEGHYNNGKVTVTSCGEIEFTSEVTVNGLITDRSTLSFMINEIIKTHQMKSKNVVISFNSGDIIARELKLPDVKLPSLQLLVKNEMLKVLGNDNEFAIDFVVSGSAGEKMLSVTAFAVNKEMVEGYYNLLKELKLSGFILDIHANSIAKLLSGAVINGNSQADSNVVVADIGYSKIVFHGFTNGASRFNRTEISPVQEFIREMASINRIDAQKSDLEQLDFSPDYVYENSIMNDTCRYFVNRIADEIQRYVQYMIINSQSKSITNIYLTGGISTIKGMDIALSNIMKIPVQTLKTVDRLTMPENCCLTKLSNAAGALIRL